MESDTTLASPQDGSQQDNLETGAQPERKMIPIPADKFREMNQELSRLRRNERTTLQTASKAPLAPAEQEALDKVADALTSRFEPLMNKVDQLTERNDTEDLDRELTRFESDPRNDMIKDDYYTALREQMRENPKQSMRELSEKAQKEALFKAFNSGRLSQDLEDQADERTRTKTRLGSPVRSAVHSGRGKQELDIRQMTPEQLVASGKVEEYFELTQGRRPRR